MEGDKKSKIKNKKSLFYQNSVDTAKHFVI